VPGAEADRGDLADPEAGRRVATQAALDALRARFGEGAIGRGRGFESTRPTKGEP
jgi:DNA polymerase-4